MCREGSMVGKRSLKIIKKIELEEDQTRWYNCDFRSCNIESCFINKTYFVTWLNEKPPKNADKSIIPNTTELLKSNIATRTNYRWLKFTPRAYLVISVTHVSLQQRSIYNCSFITSYHAENWDIFIVISQFETIRGSSG